MQNMLSICDFMFRKKSIAVILLPIFDKLQFVVSIYVKKLHRIPYLAFGTNFFPNITTAKPPTTAERQLRHAHTETSLVAISS